MTAFLSRFLRYLRLPSRGKLIRSSLTPFNSPNRPKATAAAFFSFSGRLWFFGQLSFCSLISKSLPALCREGDPCPPRGMRASKAFTTLGDRLFLRSSWFFGLYGISRCGPLVDSAFKGVYRLVSFRHEIECHTGTGSFRRSVTVENVGLALRVFAHP